MDSIGDFISQPPVQRFLFLLIGLGILYVGLVVFIVRRGAKRRRLKREQERQTYAPQSVGKTTAFSYGGNVERSVPMSSGEMNDLPEPEFHMLVTPETEGQPDATQAEGMENQPAPVAYDQANLAESSVQAEEPVQQIPVTASAASAASRSDSVPMTGNSQDAVELMRVYRDLTDGQLIIEMGGQRYRSIGQIQNPDLARRLSAVVRDLVAMLGNVRATGEIPAVPAANMGIMNPKAEPPKPQQGIFRNMARQAMGQSKPSTPETPAGIAHAVEEFLQFKLSTTPQFAMRSIHIRPGPDQGVVIEVDGRAYDAIGSVEDPQVREFLSAMMQEWSARH